MLRLMNSIGVRLVVLIGASAAGAACALAFASASIGAALRDQLGRSLAFLAAALVLQLFGLRLPGRGTLGVSAVALLAAAITLGSGPAMAIALSCAAAQWLRRRGLAHRALFDASNLALSTGAAGLCYHALAGAGSSGTLQLAAALAAGLCYSATNVGLLCLAMATSEARSPLTIWRERFHWARYHFLAFGALALLAASTYGQLGAAALLPFCLPPILLTLSMRESLARFRKAPAH